MKIEIKSWWGSVLFSNDAETLKDAVVTAVKSGANLYGANLYGADLRSADLVGANLVGADLRSADLYGANLVGANLGGANLGGANLVGANLRSANLYGANLYGANLRSADLEKTKLPSPTSILLAYWGSVSDNLCADLMEYDAWTHGDRAAFENWVKTGVCPYADALFERAANFSENKTLFGKGTLKSPIELMNLLFKEKGIKR